LDPTLYIWNTFVDIRSVRWAGAGADGWSGVREKYCWLAGGWKLVLKRYERKILLAGWRNQTANRVSIKRIEATN